MVAAVLLAAGASTRFGGTKLLVSVRGEPLVRHAARTFVEAGAGEVVVVLGARAGEIGPALEGLPVRTVVHERWADGMLSSVQRGLAAVAPDAARIAVSPADLDLLEAQDVSRVLRAASTAGESVLVVAAHGERRGHPLVLSRSVAERVLAWPLSRRLSDLLGEPDLEVREVPCGAGVLHDVDVPADLSPR
jgi:CTP:molybdopterin cytidylyltransferase MocA